MPTCGHCNQEITDRDFLESDDMCLHKACLEAWQEANCPMCAHCAKRCAEGHVELTKGGTTAMLHEECVEPFKAAKA